MRRSLGIVVRLPFLKKIQICLRYRKQRFPIPLLHRWRRPTPAERACSNTDAGEKGKGKYTVLPADQRCRPAGFDFRPAETRSSGSWREAQVILGKAVGVWPVAMNARVPKAGSNRRVSETIFDEKTSEVSFQAWQPDRQCRYIHQSWQSRATQLASVAVGVFDFRSRNPAAEPDENSEILFEIRKVDSELDSRIPAGPACYSQRRPSRKRVAMRRSLGIPIRLPFQKKIQIYLRYGKQRFPIPLLHRWRRPTPAERACSNTDAGEKGKGKYTVLPADQRCRPAGFDFRPAETRSSGSWREAQVILGKAKRIGPVAVSARVPKAGSNRRVSETIFDEKTSEVSFQAWQPDRQCRYIHQSWQSRARQLASVAVGVFDFRSRNPAAEPDENSEILFEIRKVDSELDSRIPAGPACYSQRRPSRKRVAMRRSLGIPIRLPFQKKIQIYLRYGKQRFPIPLLHRWRRPTPAERACSNTDAGEKGKGKYTVLPADQRCRPAGFDFRPAETRSSGSWREAQVILGKAKRIGPVAVSARVPKAGGNRRVSETIFDEKTSEVSFQAWQPDRQCRYIHQSWQSRATQLASVAVGVFDFRSRNPAAEPDENSEILFEIRKVDSELDSRIPAGPACYSQRRPSRKRVAMRRSLGIPIRLPFQKKIQMCLHYRKQRFPIPLLHRWRRPTPAERACSNTDAGEKGKGKYNVFPADQRCRPAGFDFRPAETRSSGSWREAQVVLGKAVGVWPVAVSARVPKAGSNRRVSETIFDEKTSEVSFQAWQPDRQCRYIHQSWQSRATQLASVAVGVFDFRSRNPAAEPDENSEILFEIRKVDLELVSPIPAGPACYSQRRPSRKRVAMRRSLGIPIRLPFLKKIQMCLHYGKQRFPIPLLHRWRRPTPAERACSNTDAGEKGKGKYTVLPADQRCRPAGFDFRPAETRSSGSWREAQVVLGKAKRIGPVAMNARVPKAGGSRRVPETIFDEKTSEVSFQAWQPDRQCRYIHQSWQSRATQLASVAVGVFDFRSRNPAAEPDENSEILFEIGEVDLELVSRIPRGPVCYCQRRPSRKRVAMRRSLGIVVRLPFLKKIQICLRYRKQCFPIPLLHRWRRPTPAERACSNTDAGEKGKGKYTVLPADQRCRPAGFDFRPAETRSSGSWREAQVILGKAKRIGPVAVSARVPKAGSNRRVSETIFDEKTSEVSFQAWQPDRQCRYIHQSWQSRATQLASVAVGVFDFRSRNPAAEPDENSEILFEIRKVDSELDSRIPAGPACYSQRSKNREDCGWKQESFKG
ncbi:Hypothetical_protein [Hexamita inflata]|uniref:Hypothetical_protein n=1 Tax=Hexamita inflata TaxID=28002 RepID=A0AA86PTQ8_9EUKA|nr:Hypothetical protein HINF_LOCUS31647 [Hexamita inflata]